MGSSACEGVTRTLGIGCAGGVELAEVEGPAVLDGNPGVMGVEVPVPGREPDAGECPPGGVSLGFGAEEKGMRSLM
ncbi:hypothetical protein CVT26_013549 [Gymnopilus dilepis]|uniref:Uncharacterized protein n=1 Tax=Gymnopilus dilepis TaxID=231916 RepID=A0A409X5H0_9AGAR|nr:hypothetical protein CVT26_013549 [Gymnopilus dilepis]